MIVIVGERTQEVSLVKFVHSADWQLGMTRHFLDADAQARYSAARIDAITTIGRIAAEHQCDFIVVCGDVYESNAVSPQTIRRSLEAMRGVSLPIYLLPGNHDPLDAASIYRSNAFLSNKPDNVTVLDKAGSHMISESAELVAAPWYSKNPTTDLAVDALTLMDEDKKVRILVAHGGVDELAPDQTEPGVISTAALKREIARGSIGYVALGDRHSTTQVGDSPIWYSGTQEVTASRETNPGNVLVVTMADNRLAEVKVEPVGTWTFLDLAADVNSSADLDMLDGRLAEIKAKDRTVVRLSLLGTLSVELRARLDEMFANAGELFASVRLWERHSQVVVRLDRTDLDALQLTGYAANAAEEIAAIATSDTDESATAGEALSLLFRLQRSVK